MEKREILEGLLEKQVLKILKVFINNADQEFYLRELAKRARVPPATTFRSLALLKKLELIKENKVKKFKFYSLHEENASFLTDIIADRKSAVADFVERIKEDPQISMIVLHGKEERSKANLLIIGANVNQDAVRAAALYAKDNFGFNIIHLTLAPEQYNQMSSMGLYPGKKVILLEK